ncbi:hypothetical protein DFH09DRAFT_1219665 [Mycena vulgaris]|nr:hypothetical protein DFH09DRAFT_1219665 [Mycena vulgaris]
MASECGPYMALPALTSALPDLGLRTVADSPARYHGGSSATTSPVRDVPPPSHQALIFWAILSLNSCKYPSGYLSESEGHSWLLQEGESDADFDFVATSQPLEDGEEDWHSYYGLTPIPKSPPSPPLASLSRRIPEPVARSDTDTTASDTRPRRAHLIRRAPPCSPPRPLPLGTVSRSRNLVRRVTMGPELERRRKHARDKARRIAKKIRALAKATARLQRKHRALCAFVREPSRNNKENVFSIG